MFSPPLLLAPWRGPPWRFWPPKRLSPLPSPRLSLPSRPSRLSFLPSNRPWPWLRGPPWLNLFRPLSRPSFLASPWRKLLLPSPWRGEREPSPPLDGRFWLSPSLGGRFCPWRSPPLLSPRLSFAPRPSRLSRFPLLSRLSASRLLLPSRFPRFSAGLRLPRESFWPRLSLASLLSRGCWEDALVSGCPAFVWVLSAFCPPFGASVLAEDACLGWDASAFVCVPALGGSAVGFTPVAAPGADTLFGWEGWLPWPAGAAALAWGAAWEAVWAAIPEEAVSLACTPWLTGAAAFV